MNKTFADVWNDIQTIVKPGQQIPTICQKSINDILAVNPKAVEVRSRRSKAGKVRVISRDDFEYAWRTLSTNGIYTLQGIVKIIGKRAITCAILAELPYVSADCVRGNVSLRLKP